MDFEHYRTVGTGNPKNKSKEGEEASDATMMKRPQEKNSFAHSYNAQKKDSNIPPSRRPMHRTYSNLNSSSHGCPSSHHPSSSSNNMGLEVNALVKQLIHPPPPHYSLSAELAHAQSISPHSFHSGKAITAILSHLVRFKKLHVALDVWDWMERS
eukprot:3987465-Ditylum_brightwellii.AAC.1